MFTYNKNDFNYFFIYKPNCFMLQVEIFYINMYYLCEIFYFVFENKDKKVLYNLKYVF